MKRQFLSVVVVWMLSVPLIAADPHFIKPADVNITALLPAPPTAGSPEAASELDTVLRLQAARTEAEAARAQSEAKLTPAAFQSVFGKDFTVENLPLTFALLTDAAADSKAMTDPAKVLYGRKRPQYVDSRVKPSITDETDPSFPGGHATRGTLWATILIEIVPEKKEELLKRGAEIGWDRVIAGVHFPSDIFAGRVLGLTQAQMMAKVPAFQAQLAKAKAEFQGFMKTHDVAHVETK